MDVIGLLSSLILLNSFVLLFLASKDLGRTWRQAFLSASVMWGFLLTAITEVLSLFHLINHGWLLGSWMLVSGIAILLLILRRFSPRNLIKIRYLARDFSTLIKANPLLGFACFSIGIILALSGFLAIAVPSNTSDSMTYHMTRVMNWIQNQSVAHYPTHILRQIDLGPWSSFAIMHLQELSGDDWFANLVQWSSMVGCLIGTSLIAKQLGANLTGQVLSSVICISIPMGLLQSATTQNDYVVSFWLVCFVHSFLMIFEQGILPRVSFELGASLGLALLTKGTAYIYSLPFCFIFLFHCIRYRKTNFWSIAVSSFIPCVLINIGHWWRNLQLLHSPLGISGDVTKNELFTPSAILSNVVRSVALHLPIAFQPINDGFERLIVNFHNAVLKLDVNDPRTTFQVTTFQLPVTSKDTPIFLHEDFSGNPTHLVLILIAVILYIFVRRLRNRRLSAYLIVSLSSALLFNILIAWQPWGSRLHLSFFVLMSAFVGTILGRFFRRFWFHYLLVFILTLGSLPYVFFSAARPLFKTSYFRVFAPSIIVMSRIERRFVTRPNLQKAYAQAIDTALDKKCYDIGLYTGGGSWQYPLWKMAQDHSQNLVRFRSVNVDNPSKDVFLDDRQNFLPCSVFALDRRNLRRKLQVKNPNTGKQVNYVRIMDSKMVKVYMNRRFLRGKRSSS